MAEDPSGGEKTEDASGKKLSDARQKGQVAKSMEIPSVSVLLAGALALYFFAAVIYKNCLAVLDDSLRFDSVPLLTDVEVFHLFLQYVERMFIMVMPVLGAVFLAAFLSNVFQVGFNISWQMLAPKFSKLNPITGFISKFSFSSKVFVDFAKDTLKLVIVFSVAYQVVRGEVQNILRLYDNSISFILLYILKIAFSIFIKVLLIMILIAILDYAYQKWKFLQDQKMTKQERKDEAKQAEGDPKVKSKIRQLQAEAARQRMMAEVPEADVVVTNPTRLAVAVKYDAEIMDAPMVTAKGAGAVALNIRRIAEDNYVPIVEDKTLARNLYSTVDIGQNVPAELFQAVAELLAYVYKLEGKTL